MRRGRLRVRRAFICATGHRHAFVTQYSLDLMELHCTQSNGRSGRMVASETASPADLDPPHPYGPIGKTV